tara:strand:- start:14403 stop:14999 length:597 start_codon:yes stop_codon:yes gene_type:complete
VKVLQSRYCKEYNLNINIDLLRDSYLDFKNKMGFKTDDKTLIDFNAICINRIPNDDNSITGGNVRGLYWTIPEVDNQEEKRLNPIEEYLYTEICPEFKDTYVEEVYNIINQKFKIGRVRFLMKPPRTCLSWHRDPDMRLHIPITTNQGNIMVIENEAFHMPSNGNAYLTDNKKYHNFFNGSELERVHLVATVLEESFT